jgi:hypothetical protein
MSWEPQTADYDMNRRLEHARRAIRQLFKSLGGYGVLSLLTLSLAIRGTVINLILAPLRALLPTSLDVITWVVFLIWVFLEVWNAISISQRATAQFHEPQVSNTLMLFESC